jgi:BirA family transcriptional regulator, biotin operon repressor / biotin---[acetyl-CoA-carboxylase] ligase
MGTFSAEVIKKRLKTRFIGKEIHYWPEVESTNAMAMQLAKKGAAEGIVVIADAQSEGRGRAGKPWYSPPGLNLYLSVLLRPSLEVRKAAPLTFIGSLAVADTIDAEGGHSQVKWPNDVLLTDKKVAGMLAELHAVGGKVEVLVLGIGVNLNVERDMLDRALGEAAWGAISLKEVLGREVERAAFAATLLENLEMRYQQFLADEGKAVMQEWKARSFLGRRVTVIEEEARLEGIALDIDKNGYLLVLLDDGSQVHVREGEVIPFSYF